MAPSPSAARSLFRLLAASSRRITSLVFPTACLACGILVARDGALCTRCWSRVAFIDHPVCPVLGTPFAHGADADMVSPAALAKPPDFTAARAVALYDEVARLLVHRLKYNDRADLAMPMARWMIRAGDDLVERADVVVPVPLHRWRLLSRRYNQAAELARAIARFSGKPLAVDILLRHRATAQQVGLGEKARETNVRGAFRVAPGKREALTGRSVLLVDDVLTTGATVNAAARALKRGGAREVFVLSFARVHGERHDGRTANNDDERLAAVED